jgi:hypothetical protein
MVRVWLLLLMGIAVPYCPAQTASSSSPGGTPDSLERMFAPGGTVTMRLSGGRYTIRPVLSNDRVRLHWAVARPEDKAKVQVTADVQGRDAVLTAHGSKGFGMEIELPESADLHILARGGDVTIRGIEGNKEVRSRSGDLTIDIGPAANYREADLSVRIGDIQAPPFNVSKGGFLRSVHWQGPGRYVLAVRVQRGTITILGR